jgi:hypothetical protein
VGALLEPLYREAARKRQLEGNSKGGSAKGKSSVNDAKLAGDDKSKPHLNKSSHQVAAAVGTTDATYRRAKAVVAAAKEDPETFGPVAEEMDRTIAL